MSKRRRPDVFGLFSGSENLSKFVFWSRILLFYKDGLLFARKRIVVENK